MSPKTGTINVVNYIKLTAIKIHSNTTYITMHGYHLSYGILSTEIRPVACEKVEAI